MNLSSALVKPMGNTKVTQNPSFKNNFPVQQQEMTNWCWAASTIGICKYYKDGSDWTQRHMAASFLNLPICDTPLPISSCNQSYDLGQALNQVNHFDQIIEGPISPQDLIETLSQAKPVGCQLFIPGLGGHAVVIVDCQDLGVNNLFVQVADPSDGTLVIMPYIQLRDNFRNTDGRWARTYLTL